MKTAAAVALVVMVFTAAVAAHETRPAYLQIKEVEPGRCDVLWKSPSGSVAAARLTPSLDADFVESGVRDRRLLRDGVLERWQVTSERGVVGGQEIRIEGLEATLTSVLVRVEFLDGRSVTTIVGPENPRWTIPRKAGHARIAWSYLQLGVEHILMGVDHLLFVLGLLLIVADRKTLIKTITSFTVAHSITLGIATLGYASAPVTPLNAAIALSILFLGPEIVRVRRGETSFTIRRPWIVAFAFGLLHGFGFAGGLTTMGLPRSEIPAALLLFNVGVEIGQIAFVLLVFSMTRSFRALEIRWTRWARALPGYAVGSLGAFWFIQRTAILLGLMR